MLNVIVVFKVFWIQSADTTSLGLVTGSVPLSISFKCINNAILSETIDDNFRLLRERIQCSYEPVSTLRLQYGILTSGLQVPLATIVARIFGGYHLRYVYAHIIVRIVLYNILRRTSQAKWMKHSVSTASTWQWIFSSSLLWQRPFPVLLTASSLLQLLSPCSWWLCGVYSRIATKRVSASIRVNMVSASEPPLDTRLGSIASFHP